MNKLLHSFALVVAVATTSMLAGCELYFGSHDHNGGGGTWNYCGTDGYYQCQGDSCTWVSPTCPAPGSSGGSGYECTSSTDCAAGCYCAGGTCEEGGFCATDADCGSGYHCDTNRSSCEPNGGSGSGSGSGSGVMTCDYDNQCPTGQYCEYDHKCVATCVCQNDTQAQQQGWGFCDESRQTCLPGEDPNGTCGGTANGTGCTTLEPRCPTGQVPVMFGGCYTGSCRDYAQCDVPPVCANINDETDCLGRTDCGGVYTGINCHKSDGSACHAGDTGCTCSSYQFSSCASK